MNQTIESLPVLVLYPHSRCNCRCIMCDIWKDARQAELSSEELQRHLEDIERLSVKWVIFSGGEPLMHSDLFRLADMLRAKNIRVTILSTGLLLKRHAEQIVARTDDVIVSLDGPAAVHDGIRRVPGAFAQLEQGVRRIHELNPGFHIAARCTVQKLNHRHINDTSRAAKALGLCSISFLAVDVSSDAFSRGLPWSAERQQDIALSSDEIARLEAQFEAVLDEWNGTGFVLENSEKLDRIVRHFRAQLGECEPEAPVCNAPWVSAVVETDGTVRPCFFHRPIGSIRTQSLYQVLNGFEAQNFRSSLNIARDPVCRRCVCSLNLKVTM